MDLPVSSDLAGILSHSLILSTSRLRVNYMSIEGPLDGRIDIQGPPSAPGHMCIPPHASHQEHFMSCVVVRARLSGGGHGRMQGARCLSSVGSPCVLMARTRTRKLRRVTSKFRPDVSASWRPPASCLSGIPSRGEGRGLIRVGRVIRSSGEELADC